MKQIPWFLSLAILSATAFAAEPQLRPATPAQLQAAYPRLQSLFEANVNPGDSPDVAFLRFSESLGDPKDQAVFLPVLVHFMNQEETLIRTRPSDPKKLDAWRDKTYFDSAQEMRKLKREIEARPRISGEQVMKVLNFAMRMRAVNGRFVTDHQFEADAALDQLKAMALTKGQAIARANPAVSERVGKTTEGGAEGSSGESGGTSDYSPIHETGAAQAD